MLALQEGERSYPYLAPPERNSKSTFHIFDSRTYAGRRLPQSPDVTRVGTLATEAEEIRFDGLWVHETAHSPYIMLTLATDHGSGIGGSVIVVAFPGIL
jgi:hypothetical protein